MSTSYGWGLIGPGRFAREFADELRTNPRANCVAVASRDLEKATGFANDFGFQRAYGDYEAIVTDNEVDIIYVVVPHVFHRKIAELAINAGKPVLCEKPLTTSYEESKGLTTLAAQKGVFLMEAFKTAFLPAVKQTRSWIMEGRIGTPKLLKADFCFNGPGAPEDRLMNPDLGGGAILDVGIYPIYLAQHFLGEITSTKAEGCITRTGVEDTAVITTRHSNGALSALTCSFQTGEEAMNAEILGTEGTIEIPFFHRASKAVMKKEGKTIEEFESSNDGMLYGEIEAVMESLDRGETECPGHTHADTLVLARLMDETRNSILSGE